MHMAIQMNPYLNFNGNSEEAFNLYKSVFGGDFAVVMRFGDNPQCGEMSDDDKKRILHIALPINGGGMLMASDSLESLGQKLNLGNNFHISLSPETREEADLLFAGLSAGGTVETAMCDMFWGYFGCFTDKFGIGWMLNVGNGQPA
jgi:PhnB protein